MTLGHLDIIERSSRIVDELNVAVLKNNAKNPLFSADERVSMIKEFTSHLPNVTVTAYDGLLADYADQIGANIIVRGLRAVTDFEYELQIAQTNHAVNPKIDTIFSYHKSSVRIFKLYDYKGSSILRRRYIKICAEGAGRQSVQQI